jgi:hypothetical protein
MKPTVYASAATLDAIQDCIARFYCGESKTLIPVKNGLWAVHWAHGLERLDGVQVQRRKSRFYFEVAA